MIGHGAADIGGNVSQLIVCKSLTELFRVYVFGKVVRFLERTQIHLRMLLQVMEQGSGATLIGSDYDESR